jgi:hypothetical protein
MRKLTQLLFIMLLGVALLAACGEDTASDDNTTETNNNDATESEEGNERAEEENTNNEGTDNEANEDTEVDDEESNAENNDDSTGYAEDQDLTMGETGIYDSTLGTYEITLNAARTEDEVEGQDPIYDLYVITEVTIKNVSEDSIDAVELAASDMLNDQELSYGEAWDYGFEGEKIEPGETIDGELVFDVSESSYYELVYGYAKPTVANEVRWRFEVDDIE